MHLSAFDFRCCTVRNHFFCSPSSQDYNIYDRVSHNIAMPFSMDSSENTFALGDFNSHQLNYNVNFSVTRCLNEIVE